MRGAAGLPRVRVEADGAELPTPVARSAAAVRVRQRLSLPTSCEITFLDPAADASAESPLRPGTAVRVSVEGFAEPLFAGEVTAVEHVYDAGRGSAIRVRGYDLLHRLRKRQPVRAHVRVSAADLAEDLVADLGLSVEARERGPLWERLIQHCQTDLGLLSEAAERSGLYFTVRDSVLHVLTLDGIGDPVPLALGDSLLEARIEVNGDSACRAISALGWDPHRGEPRRGSAGGPRLGRRVAAEVAPASVGGSGERMLVDESVRDDRQADALAQAELDRCAAREVTLWGVADGDPRLRPGAPVEVSGVAESLSGRYVLTDVTHTIDAERGFLSELSSAPAPPRARPRAAIVTTASVTRVDDPEGLGRVRVSLPTYDDVETDWLGVVMAGAGAGKGLVMVPDVGDQVLVLFSREDPAQGVVVGGLYGANAPPDGCVDGGRVCRFSFVTPGGQRLRLDDARDTVRLENTRGSYVELAPGRVSVHADADLTLEAPGRAIVIRGRTVDFQQG